MNLQIPVAHRLVDTSFAGGWWVFARPRNAPIANISFFRGAPVLLGDFSFSSPYGPKDISLTFPTVSVHDRLGYGDLYWMRKKVSFDVIWPGVLPGAYPFGRWAGPRSAREWIPAFAWEGFLTGFSYGDDGMTVTGKGEFYQLDDYLAKPEFLTRPLPYEHAIARQFLEKPHLRMMPLQVNWPAWWNKTYHPPKKGTPAYLIPAGIHKGAKWTGMVTRTTGSWEPVLSSYITTLQNAMYTRRGRWVLDLQRGRVPTLSHLDILTEPNNSTVIVDAVSPDVKLNQMEVDWAQSIDVAFAQGTSLAGVAYSGMQVSSDGSRTFYEPFASLRQAYPEDNNDWLDLSAMPREVLLQMQPGLSDYDARKVAQANLERFGEPGVTGQVELSGDVLLGDGSVIPHYLVRAGMSMQIRNVFGIPDGVMVHISDNTVSPQKGINTCQFDSKYRDALTVEEVRLRGRDSLAISRMLVGGQYTPPLPDMLLPWNYAEGSGVIPSAPFRNANPLFQSMPDNMQFPWTKWTTTHPPSSGRWRHCYIKIPAASANADKNWSGVPRDTGGRYGIGIRMAQAGSIRLIQFAAYDGDGNVLRIPFHVSFYYMSGVNVKAMPMIPAGESHPPYATGQHYPFVIDAFEEYNTDGTEKGIEVPMPVRSAGLWRAFGTDRVKAGYWPGDGSGDPTGLMVDEQVVSFDTTKYGQFNPYSRKGNLTNPDAGMLYVMVYCDAQGTDPVYFLGRMFRVEPGTQGGEG